MKKQFSILLITTFLLSSCSPYHIGTGDKLNNLTHWKKDKEEKKLLREIKKQKEVAKY